MALSKMCVSETLALKRRGLNRPIAEDALPGMEQGSLVFWRSAKEVGFCNKTQDLYFRLKELVIVPLEDIEEAVYVNLGDENQRNAPPCINYPTDGEAEESAVAPECLFDWRRSETFLLFSRLKGKKGEILLVHNSTQSLFNTWHTCNKLIDNVALVVRDHSTCRPINAEIIATVSFKTQLKN